MAEAILQQKIFPYDGSMDSTKHPLLLSPKDIVDSNNLIYTSYSTKKQRPGLTEAFTSTLGGTRKILGGVDFHRNGVQKIVYWDGLRLRAANLAGVVDDITGPFELPTDEAVSFCKFAGLLLIFFQDEETPIYIWTGTGDISLLSPDAPLAPFGRIWLNKLWVPDPSVPGRVMHTNTGDPTDFTGGDAGEVDLDVNDGDPLGISAIFPPYGSTPGVVGNLYIAKQLSVYKIEPVVLSDGTVLFRQAKISDGVGCISHNSVVATEDNILFASDRGVHYFQSTDKVVGIESAFLSQKIQTDWEDDVNFLRAKYMWGVYDINLNAYLLAFPRRGQNYSTEIWGYSLVVKEWYRWRSYNQTCLFRYIDGTTKKVRTMVGGRTGRFGYIDKNNKKDYDQGISCYFQSGIICPTGAPDDRYCFKFIAPIFKPQLSGKINIKMRINSRQTYNEDFSMVSSEEGDELGTTFVTGQSVLGGLPSIKIDKRTLGGYGMMYELLITHEPSSDADDTEDFEMLGILVDVDRVNSTIGEVNS